MTRRVLTCAALVGLVVVSAVLVPTRQAAAATLRTTSTTVTCTPGSVTVGGATKCTATVKDTAAGTPSTPAGTITFTSSTSGTFSPVTCTLSGGSCASSFSPSAGGQDTISAAYSGDKSHAASRGATTITAAAPTHPTSTTVSCELDTSHNGNLTWCSVTVTDTSATPSTPTGSVSFASSTPGQFYPPSCTLSDGWCAAHFAPTASGNDTITATYAGDSVHASSSASTTATMVVAEVQPTTTTLSCSPSSVVVGTGVDCTVTVDDLAWSPSPPAGGFTFSESGAAGTLSATSCSIDTGDGCWVTFTPTAAGTATITATYTGDATHSASRATTQATGRTAKDQTSLQAGCSDTSPGTATTCSAMVTDITNPSTPTGTLTFTTSFPGTFAATTCTLYASWGTDGCGVTFTPSAPGSGTVTVTYSGDATDAASTASTPINVYDPTSTALTCTPTNVAAGAETTCTAKVTDTLTGSLLPTGTMSWTSAGTAEATPSSSTCALSSAACSITWTAAPGTAAITASYTGDSKHRPSASPAVSITVGSSATTVTCTGTALDGSSPTQCTAHVSSPWTGTVTGTVTFSDGSLAGLWESTYPAPATCQLANGQCSVTYIPTGTGQVSFEADYSGDADYAGSTGTTTQQTTTGVLSTSHTTVACNPSTINVSQGTTCTATVTDAVSGAPLAGTTVGFTSSGPGTFAPAWCTVAAGTCSVGFSPTAAGSDLITAVDGGDRTYAPSSGRTTVTVGTATTIGTTPDVLTALGPGTAYYGTGPIIPIPWIDTADGGFRIGTRGTGLSGSLRYDTAVLTDTTGHPLAGRTVTFSGGGWSQTAVTDTNGFAAVDTIDSTPWSGSTPGAQPAGYTVTFTGDTTYVPNTATWP